MRSKYILGVLGVGLVIAAAGGCGSDADDNTGGTGGSGAAGSASSTGVGAQATSSSTTTGTATSSSSTVRPDTNVDCASGVAIDLGQLGEETLDPADMDEDFFTFEGTKGQVIALLTDAKPDDDPFADGYADLVITLYGPDDAQVAENDDPIPRNTQDSELYTVLPEDGKYCIKVQDFCKWSEDKGTPCPATAVPVDDGAFGVLVTEFDPELAGNVEHVEANASTPMEYAKVDMPTVPNSYYTTAVNGFFETQGDVDVFSFNIPVDVPCDQNGTACTATADQRPTANFEVFPTGADGNGSTIPTGDLWVTTAVDTETILARIDGSKVDPVFGATLQPPLTFGTDYLLHVRAPTGATPGANPFYFLIHYGSGSNPLEVEQLLPTNDTALTAEPMASGNTTGGGIGYFVGGTIVNKAGDVDWYSLDNLAEAGQVLFGTCASQRIGSGVRGLKLTIYDAADLVDDIGSAPAETADSESTFGDAGLDVSSAGATLLAKVEATGSPDVVVGAYYNCGITFGVPQ
jgi:hypothetical protein